MRIFFLFLLSLGLFSYPLSTDAMNCEEGKSTDLSCCAQEDSHGDHALDCEQSEENQHPKEHDPCSDGCPSSHCNCPISISVLPIFTEIKSTLFLFDQKKALFPSIPSKETLRFYAIWRPPKIS